MRISLGIVAAVCLVFVTAVHGIAQDVYTYHVKGIVKVLPGAGRASNEILVKHEPIPEYRDQAGNIVGMSAMTMPFYIAKGVSLESISVGDEVEMVVEQRLKPRFTEEVVSLKKSK